MHYVYVLKSTKNGQIYVGETSDLRRRFSQHNDNETASTANKGPWKLVYYESYSDPRDAHEREKMLKHYGTTLGHLRKRIRHSLGGMSGARQTAA